MATRSAVVAMLLSVACLASAESGAKSVSYVGQRGGFVYVAFDQPGCWPSGSRLGAHGEKSLSSRASTKLCPIGTGWLTCAADELCVTERGALIDPARTNHIYQSRAFNLPNWAPSGTASVSADFYPDPSGSASMDRVTANAGALIYEQAASVASSTGPFTGSAWVRSDTGTSSESVNATCPGGNAVTSCTCSVSQGTCTATGATNFCTATTTAGTTPVRLSATFTCTAATTTPYLNAAPGAYPSSGGVGGYFEGTIEVGPFSSSPMLTYGGTASRSVDVVQIASPLPRVFDHCAVAEFAPAWGDPWNATTVALLSGGTYGQPNSWSLTSTKSRTIALSVYDGDGAEKVIAASHTWDPGSLHTIAACNAGGTLALYDGAVQLAGTTTGAGTGVFSTMPAGVYLGALSTPGSEPSLFVKELRICRGASPAACRPAGAYVRSRPTGISRYVTAAMPRDLRMNSARLTAYPFRWPPDPVPIDDTRLRTAPWGSSGGPNGSMTWSNVHLTINTPPGWDRQWRDGSFAYDRALEKYWFVISSIRSEAAGWTASEFAVFSSSDGVTWDFVTWVTVPGSPWRVWTPTIFVEDDGTVYVLVSVEQSDGTGMGLYLYRNDDPSTWATWTALGAVTGSAIQVNRNGVQNVHDAFLWKRSGTYYLLSRCEGTETGGCTGGEIGIATASSLQGPYNTGHLLTGPTSAILRGEGISVLELPPGSTYRWRLFLDDVFSDWWPGMIVSFDTNDWVTFTSSSNVLDETAGWQRNTDFVLGL